MAARQDPADWQGRTPRSGCPVGPDALDPLLRAHTKPAKGPAADQGIRPALFSLRARHAHGHQLEMHRIAPEIRPHQTRQPRRIVHAHAALLQPRYHGGGVERHAARVAGIGHEAAWAFIADGKAPNRGSTRSWY